MLYLEDYLAQVLLKKEIIGMPLHDVVVIEFDNRLGYASFCGGHLYFRGLNREPIPTYQDKELTILNTYPIIFDAAGRVGPIYLGMPSPNLMEMG